MNEKREVGNAGLFGVRQRQFPSRDVVARVKEESQSTFQASDLSLSLLVIVSDAKSPI